METRLLRQQISRSVCGTRFHTALVWGGRQWSDSPKGLATASAVPPARGAPTSGRRAGPPHPAQARMATRVRVCALPEGDPPLACLHPRNPTSPAAGQAWGEAVSGNRGTRGLPPGGGSCPLSRGVLSPRESLGKLCSAPGDRAGQVGGGPRRTALPSQTPTSYSVIESPLSGGRMTQRSPRSQAPWSP